MKALVISGGGSKGAYAVGIIHYLSLLGYKWDMIIGTSTGALIAPLVAANKIEEMAYIYTHVTTKDILKKRCFLTIPFSNSIYSTTPLKKLINKQLSDDIFHKCKNVAACVLNLNTGKQQYIWGRNCSKKEFALALLASSNQPILMPPINIFNKTEYFVDGGVRDVLPIRGAIENGATSILGIGLDHLGVKETNKKYNHLFSIGMRTLEIMMDETTINDTICPSNISVKVIRPLNPLDMNSLSFNPKKMKEAYDIGFNEAKHFF